MAELLPESSARVNEHTFSLEEQRSNRVQWAQHSNWCQQGLGEEILYGETEEESHAGKMEPTELAWP